MYSYIMTSTSSETGETTTHMNLDQIDLTLDSVFQRLPAALFALQIIKSSGTKAEELEYEQINELSYGETHMVVY